MNKLWVIVLTGFFGCSGSVILPEKAPSPPTLIRLPHPVGEDLGDLAALMRDPLAPQLPNHSEICQKDVRSLLNLSQSKEEQMKGIRELIQKNPEAYHWCFYSVLNDLEEWIKQKSYLDERQAIIISSYQFLAPVAKVFSQDYLDTRYYRAATRRYQDLNRSLFNRKLELTPEGVRDMVNASNPYGSWRTPEDPQSVVEKYHLQPKETR